MPTPTAAPPRKRPFRVLPPITRGPEALDGAAVLEEVSGDVGVLLWQSLRNVMLWTAASSAERAALFSENAARRRADALRALALDPALRSPVEVVAALLAAPGGADAARLAYACASVASWAEERACAGTALAFAQAAALACPGDAGLAYAVGRLARMRGETVRAEGWYHQAIMLARQARDWRTYVMAFLGLGNLAVQRGNFPSARRHQLRALRTSRRHGLRALQAAALHDLFVVALEAGDVDEMDRRAAEALRAYGTGHPRVPVLAHDVAVAWMARGQSARALPVLEAVLPHLRDPASRVVAQANVARAAGGAGRADVFNAAAIEVTRHLLSPAAAAGAAQALLNVARGALSLGEREHARAAAAQAERLAERSSEGKVRVSAGEILDRLAETPPAAAARAPEVDLDAPGELAGELVRSLAVSAAGG